MRGIDRSIDRSAARLGERPRKKKTAATFYLFLQPAGPILDTLLKSFAPCLSGIHLGSSGTDRGIIYAVVLGLISARLLIVATPTATRQLRYRNLIMAGES